MPDLMGWGHVAPYFSERPFRCLLNMQMVYPAYDRQQLEQVRQWGGRRQPWTRVLHRGLHRASLKNPQIQGGGGGRGDLDPPPLPPPSE